MNILKKSALATILSLMTYNANAEYTGDQTFQIDVEMGSDLTVLVNEAYADVITMTGLIDGDDFKISIPVTIEGSVTTGDGTAREIECYISGGAASDTSSTEMTSSDDFYIVQLTTDGTYSGTSVTQVTLSLLNDCEAGDGTAATNYLIADANAISGSEAGEDYSTGVLTFSVNYVTQTEISSYSS